jgi:hypothetical protein
MPHGGIRSCSIWKILGSGFDWPFVNKYDHTHHVPAGEIWKKSSATSTTDHITNCQPRQTLRWRPEVPVPAALAGDRPVGISRPTRERPLGADHASTLESSIPLSPSFKGASSNHAFEPTIPGTRTDSSLTPSFADAGALPG